MIKLIRSFHHRRMAAFVYKMQFTVRNQPVKFFCHKGWGYGVIISPNKTCRLFYLAYLFTQVVTYGAFSKGYNFYYLKPVVGNFKHFIYQILGCKSRVIKGKCCFIADIFFISSFSRSRLILLSLIPFCHLFFILILNPSGHG